MSVSLAQRQETCSIALSQYHIVSSILRAINAQINHELILLKLDILVMGELKTHKNGLIFSSL